MENNEQLEPEEITIPDLDPEPLAEDEDILDTDVEAEGDEDEGEGSDDEPEVVERAKKKPKEDIEDDFTGLDLDEDEEPAPAAKKSARPSVDDDEEEFERAEQQRVLHTEFGKRFGVLEAKRSVLKELNDQLAKLADSDDPVDTEKRIALRGQIGIAQSEVKTLEAEIEPLGRRYSIEAGHRRVEHKLTKWADRVGQGIGGFATTKAAKAALREMAVEAARRRELGEDEAEDQVVWTKSGHLKPEAKKILARYMKKNGFIITPKGGPSNVPHAGISQASGSPQKAKRSPGGSGAKPVRYSEASKNKLRSLGWDERTIALAERQGLRNPLKDEVNL